MLLLLELRGFLYALANMSALMSYPLLSLSSGMDVGAHPHPPMHPQMYVAGLLLTSLEKQMSVVCLGTSRSCCMDVGSNLPFPLQP